MRIKQKLKKFNREHDIISKKLVGFEEIKEKISVLMLEKQNERKDIEFFKNTLFNIIQKIDDYKFCLEELEKLRDYFLKGFNPVKKDVEIDAEFLNQLDNMKKNKEKSQVLHQQAKIEHVNNIQMERQKNEELIKKIQDLKNEIETITEKKKKKKNQMMFNKTGALIGTIKKLESMNKIDFETKQDKIDFFKTYLDKRKKAFDHIKDIADNQD